MIFSIFKYINHGFLSMSEIFSLKINIANHTVHTDSQTSFPYVLLNDLKLSYPVRAANRSLPLRFPFLVNPDYEMRYREFIIF